VSDPLSVGELASRAEKAIIAGAPPRGDRPGGGPESGEAEAAFTDPDAGFAPTVRKRMASPRGSLFTFVRIALPDDPARRQALRDALEREIREEQGDLLGAIPDGIGLVLQGSEVSQASAFLQRLRARIGGKPAELDFELLSGTLNADRIRALLPPERP
jgi:hypothetical protein